MDFHQDLHGQLMSMLNHYTFYGLQVHVTDRFKSGDSNPQLDDSNLMATDSNFQLGNSNLIATDSNLKSGDSNHTATGSNLSMVGRSTANYAHSIYIVINHFSKNKS